jgi:hypothetical protein
MRESRRRPAILHKKLADVKDGTDRGKLESSGRAGKIFGRLQLAAVFVLSKGSAGEDRARC